MIMIIIIIIIVLLDISNVIMMPCSNCHNEIKNKKQSSLLYPNPKGLIDNWCLHTKISGRTSI
jgi:hypothetical protein